MRELVLDTETTGLSPHDGDRLVEIACITLNNHLPTGEIFHEYFNPQMPMPIAAEKIHGLTDDFLSTKPLFSSLAKDFLNFIGDDPLIIHNAPFDLGFINAELVKLKSDPLPEKRAIDTLELARKSFPGSPASLNALCRRFEIDNSARTFHGALLDAELLAEVYLELIGGRQPNLVLETKRKEQKEEDGSPNTKHVIHTPRPHQATDQELSAHEEFLRLLKDPIWSK